MKTIRLFKKVLARSFAPAIPLALFSFIPLPAQANVSPHGVMPIVSAGGRHSMAVRSDGTVWAWGGNASGQLGGGTGDSHALVRVSGLTDVVAVAAGGIYSFMARGWEHSLALRSDGTVWAWGNNQFGQLGSGTLTMRRPTPAQVTGLTDVASVAAGEGHSLALRSDGTVWAWGLNIGGQLGDETTTAYRLTPVQVTGLADVVALAAGESHSLAIKSDGALWEWGMGRPTPAQVTGLTGVAAVAAGGSHSLALLSDGTVWAWGDNWHGQLGDGTTTRSLTPVQVTGLTGVVDVAAGGSHSLALKSDGTVWAWGRNEFGQLGDGTTTNRHAPALLPGLRGVAAVAAGGSHSLAVKSDGKVLAWGQNSSGRLGDGTTTNRHAPVLVFGFSGIVAVSAGGEHSLAVRADRTVWAWGSNSAGQLGDGTTTSRLTPARVTGLTDVAAVAGGERHSLAVKSDGTVWAWGDNLSGQLGDGTMISRLIPVQIGLNNVVAVAAGGEHSLAVRSDGTVWAWGANSSGQLGDGTTTSRLTPAQVSGLIDVVAVAAGRRHSLASSFSSRMNRVFVWGENHRGQLGDGTTISRLTPVQIGLNNVMAVAAGREHSLAMDLSQMISAWGENRYGQLGDGTTTRRLFPTRVSGFTGTGVVVAVAAGGDHSFALRADGTMWTVGNNTVGRVWAWGNNEFGQLGDGTTMNWRAPMQVSGLTSVMAVVAGGDHSLALKSDGTVWTWGRNWEGQLGDGTTMNWHAPMQVSGFGFEGWIAAGGVPAGRRGVQDDPDGDGVENLAEYAFAGNPAHPDRAVLPVTGIETIGDDSHLTLTVSRNPDATGVAIVVEVSTDLENWFSGVGHTTVINETGTQLIVSDNMPLAGAARRFIRSRVVTE